MTQRHSGHSCDILLTSPLRDSGDYRAIQIQRMIKRSRRSVSGTSSSASRLFNYIYQVVGSERLAVQRDLAFDRRELSLSPSLPLSLSLSFSEKKSQWLDLHGWENTMVCGLARKLHQRTNVAFFSRSRRDHCPFTAAIDNSLLSLGSRVVRTKSTEEATQSLCRDSWEK